MHGVRGQRRRESTAAARLDGFWEMGLNPWDVAAAALIVEEAGGAVTDFSGGADYVWGREMAATNGRIHGEVLDMVGRAANKRSG